MTSFAITARCIEEDLASADLSGIAASLIEKFFELRGQAPDGGEPISGLRQRECRSLHASRYRGVTWYDHQRDTVWLLAAHTHREDSRDDAYAVAMRLEQAGLLYPTEADYAQLARDNARNEYAARVSAEAQALQQLRDQVVQARSAKPQSYTSRDGLYAEMWAEVDPETALLTLRLRLFRPPAQGLTADEIATFLEAVFSHHPYDQAGDSDGRFYRYIGLFAL